MHSSVRLLVHFLALSLLFILLYVHTAPPFSTLLQSTVDSSNSVGKSNMLENDLFKFLQKLTLFKRSWFLQRIISSTVGGLDCWAGEDKFFIPYTLCS